MRSITFFGILIVFTQVITAITYQVPATAPMREVDAQALIHKGLQAIYSKFGNRHRYNQDSCDVVFKDSVLIYYFTERFEYGQYCHVFEYDSVNGKVLQKSG